MSNITEEEYKFLYSLQEERSIEKKRHIGCTIMNCM